MTKFILSLMLMISINSAAEPKKYDLPASIVFTNGEMLDTTIESAYPASEETTCQTEKMVFTIIIDEKGSLSTAPSPMSGSDQFWHSTTEAISTFVLPEKYQQQQGVMSIDFSIFSDSSSESQYHEFQELLDQEKYDLAMQKLESISEADKNAVCVLMSKGQVLTKQQDYQASLTYYDQAVNISPTNASIYYSRAYRKNKIEDFEDALRDLERAKALSTKDEFWEVYYLFNEIYNQQEKYLSAISYATLGLKHRQGYYFYNRRAWSYYANENYKLAELDFGKVIELEPQKTIGYIGKSRALNQQQKYDQAMIFINKALEINGEHQDALFDKGIIYNNLKNFDKAIAMYKIVYKRFGATEKIYNNLGWSLILADRFAEAIELYQLSLSQFDGSTRVRNNLASALYFNEQYQASLNRYKSTIEKYTGDNVFAHAGLAQNYIKLGDLPNALTEIEYLVAHDIHYTDSYYQEKHGQGNFFNDIVDDFEAAAKDHDNPIFLQSIHDIKEALKNEQ